MQKAKISEIFLSYQGEGPYLGSRQLFIRAYGCNRGCLFCDTKLESYKTFTKDSLMGKVLDLGDGYNELVLTGGEPLLYAGFFEGFLPLYRNLIKKPVYLETNGTIVSGIKQLKDLIDVVAMDIKLPSSTGEDDGIWGSHERFLEETAGKEVIVKAVVTNDTSIYDIKSMSVMLKNINPDVQLVLQPVSPENDRISAPDAEMLTYFSKFLEQELNNEVLVLGQVHKCVGIR